MHSLEQVQPYVQDEDAPLRSNFAKRYLEQALPSSYEGSTESRCLKIV